MANDMMAANNRLQWVALRTVAEQEHYCRLNEPMYAYLLFLRAENSIFMARLGLGCSGREQ
jgi:hypothetical protein